MRLAAWLGLVLLLVPVAARGDDTADEADFRFRRGAALYSKRDFEGALAEFFTSNRLVHNHNVVFNIARTLEQIGRVNEAYRYYSSLLDEKLSEGDHADVLTSLQRLAPRVALLVVGTEPPGATVYIDRRDLGGLGQTPRTLALTPGKVKVILDLPGYYPVEKDGVALTVGQRTELSVPLKRIMGTLVLTVTPAEATAHLDRADGDVLTAQSQIVPGRHTVWFSAPGFVDQTIEVDVPPEGHVPLAARLAPRPNPSGALVVRANLDGALITVDGKEMGFTPGVIEGVNEGDHQVSVIGEGREPFVGAVHITANERAFVDAKLRYAQPKVEAASKTEQRASDAPASITVISREEIRAFGYQTLAEALQSVRGIYISDDRTYTYVGIRGFSPLGDYNTRLLILVDGHPVFDPWVGQGYVGRELDVDLGDVERIEVIRGSGSALYGSGAMFGVINVVHRATPDGAHPAIEGGVGTLGEEHGRATASLANDRGSILLSGAGYNSSGDPVYVSPEPYYGVSDVNHVDSEKALHADLRARYGEFQLLGAFNTRSRDTPPPLYYTVFGDPTQSTDAIGYGELRFDHRFGDQGAFVAARGYYDGSRYKGDYPYPATATQAPIIGGGAVVNNLETGGADALGAEVRVGLPVVFYNHLTAGLEFQDRFRVFQTSQIGGVFGLDQDGANAWSETVASGYLNDDLVISPKLSFVAAARIDDYGYSTSAANQDLYPVKEPNLLAVTPRVAMVAHPYEGATTKLLLGKAFRAPTVYELFYFDGNSQAAAGKLDPETSYTAELEHTHPFTDEFSLTGAVYYTDFEELIQLVPCPSGSVGTCNQGTGLLVYQNQSQPVTSYGAEIEARYQPGRALLLEAQYAYQHTRTQDGQQLLNSPSSLGAARVMVPIVPDLLTVASEIIYSGPRLAQPDATGTSPMVGEAVLWNLMFSGEYARYHLTYSAGVLNLLDDQYSQPAAGAPTGITVAQHGRTLRMTVGLRF